MRETEGIVDTYSSHILACLTSEVSLATVKMDITLNSSLPPADSHLNTTTGALDVNATLSAMRCPFGVLGNMTRLDGNQSFLCNGREIPPEDTNSIIIAIIITALYSMICVVGLFGNVLVMYVIVR